MTLFKIKDDLFLLLIKYRNNNLNMITNNSKKV